MQRGRSRKVVRPAARARVGWRQKQATRQTDEQVAGAYQLGYAAGVKDGQSEFEKFKARIEPVLDEIHAQCEAEEAAERLLDGQFDGAEQAAWDSFLSGHRGPGGGPGEDGPGGGAGVEGG